MITLKKTHVTVVMSVGTFELMAMLLSPKKLLLVQERELGHKAKERHASHVAR